MLAVTVPPTKDVLAIIVAILAEPASSKPITLAEAAFNCVLAVIVPPTKEVLAIILAILAEPASRRPTTLADAELITPLANNVVVYEVVVCANGVMIHVFDVKLATRVLPPTTKLFASVTLPFNSVLFATYKLGPLVPLRPTPLICKFATFATPSTRRPTPVEFAAYMKPCVLTVKPF